MIFFNRWRLVRLGLAKYLQLKIAEQSARHKEDGLKSGNINEIGFDKVQKLVGELKRVSEENDNIEDISIGFREGETRLIVVVGSKLDFQKESIIISKMVYQLPIEEQDTVFLNYVMSVYKVRYFEDAKYVESILLAVSLTFIGGVIFTLLGKIL